MYSLHILRNDSKNMYIKKKIWITIAEIFRTRHLIINRLSYLKGPCWCFKLLSFREWAQELFLYWKGRSRIAAVRILCFTSWCLDFNFTPCLKKARIVFCSFGFLTLSAWAGGGTHCAPCRFFDRCILTGRALKLILYDFSSNFTLNMWPVEFFWSVE